MAKLWFVKYYVKDIFDNIAQCTVYFDDETKYKLFAQRVKKKEEETAGKGAYLSLHGPCDSKNR